jgi:hypothetical protein
MRLVGKGGIEAISRLMGFLLVCMGVQFIINGVLEIISTLSRLTVAALIDVKKPADLTTGRFFCSTIRSDAAADLPAIPASGGKSSPPR